MSDLIKVVGLLGRAGHGKTTAAEWLLHHYGAVRVSFAGPLKDLAKRVMEFSDDQLYGHKKEEIDPRYGFAPRVFLQRLGEGARQVLGKNVWVTGAEMTVRRLSRERHRLFVIDDMRYTNEVAIVARWPNYDWHMNVRIIKLVCPDAPLPANPTHPSETEVDRADEKDVHATVVHRRSEGLERLYGGLADALKGFLP